MALLVKGRVTERIELVSWERITVECTKCGRRYAGPRDIVLRSLAAYVFGAACHGGEVDALIVELDRTPLHDGAAAGGRS